jgi:serine/alanine adding enzyme
LNTSFFHNALLARILEDSDYFNPEWIDSDHQILGLASGGLYTERVIVYGNPCSTTEEIDWFNFTIDKYSGNSVYLEIRNLSHDYLLRHKLQISDFIWQDWYNIVIDTLDRDHCWNKVSSSKKRQIERSIDNGAEIIHDPSLEQLKEFYKILKKLYRRKIGKPLPDWNFFKSFYHHTKNTNWGKFVLVEYDGKIISGMMCPITPNQEMFEWYIAGLDHDFKGTGIYPSSIATWGAIEYSSRNNIPKFNFMGAGHPGDDYGVRDFKLKFGGELINVGRHIRINKPLLYNIGKTYIKIRKH